MLVRAIVVVTEPAAGTSKTFVHAHKGDYGRITGVNRKGDPTVLFERTGTSVVVDPEREIEVADEKAKAEEDMVHTFFGHQGMCGCDGAYDDGCPICTPEKREAFLKEFRELVKKYR